VGRFHAPALQSNVRSCRADGKCGIKLPGCIETLRRIHYQTSEARRRPGHASQRSLHNAPIFRLLLKVAVKGTHQCDFLNFCRDLCPNKCLVTTACELQATSAAAFSWVFAAMTSSHSRMPGRTLLQRQHAIRASHAVIRRRRRLKSAAAVTWGFAAVTSCHGTSTRKRKRMPTVGRLRQRTRTQSPTRTRSFARTQAQQRARPPAREQSQRRDTTTQQPAHDRHRDSNRRRATIPPRPTRQRLLPIRVRCAWRCARPVQRLRASEQARENTAPKEK
jgi:hypothetical protein